MLSKGRRALRCGWCVWHTSDTILFLTPSLKYLSLPSTDCLNLSLEEITKNVFPRTSFSSITTSDRVRSLEKCRRAGRPRSGQFVYG